MISSTPDGTAQVLPKIVIVGPVAPFRGGIAQHTTRLSNALAEIADVRVISFARLYPRWLYPGQGQTEQSGLLLRTPVEFLLDSVNPFSWQSVVSRIAAQSPICVVMPWWTVFLAPCYRHLARQLRRRMIPVVFFCHNVVDHEAARWKRLFARNALCQGVGFVVQARDEQQALRGLLGSVDVLYHPHPIYDQFPVAERSLPRRAALELLFYGFIRPYKGLDILLEALSGLQDLSFHLSIVGEPWGEKPASWQQRIHQAGLDERVELVPRYVNDIETAEYFARADVVVLPYLSATGAGVVATAAHYRKPVIASNVGCMKDSVLHGKTGLLVSPGDPLALQSAIRRFSIVGIPDAATNIEAATSTMTWQHLAEELLETVRRTSDGFDKRR